MGERCFSAVHNAAALLIPCVLAMNRRCLEMRRTIPSRAASVISTSPLVVRKLIDDHTLDALTIMIAESKPEEKEMMISVIMNCMSSH